MTHKANLLGFRVTSKVYRDPNHRADGLVRPSPLFLLAICTVLSLAGHIRSQSLPSQRSPSTQPSPRTNQPQTSSAPSSPPPPQVAVPLPEVADRLNKLDRLQRRINAQLFGDQDSEKIAEELKVANRNLAERADQVEVSLREAPTFDEVREMEADWQQQGRKLDRQLDPVTQRLTELENHIRQLESEKAVWELTRTQYQQQVGTEIVVQRIDNALTQIDNALALAQKRRQSSLVLQNLLSQQVLLISEVLEKIRAAESQYNNSLFQPDRRPLWQIWSTPQTGLSFGEQTRQAISNGLSHTWKLVKGGWLSLLLMPLIFLLVSSLALRLARKTVGWQEGRTGHGDASLFYSHPERVSLVLAIWFLSWLYPVAPTFLGHVVASLTFIIFLVLIPPLFPAVFRPFLYLFTAIYTLARLWSFFASVPLLERLTSLVALAAIIVTVLWLMRPSRLEKLPEIERLPGLVIRTTWMALALLFVALVANLSGYFALSKLLSRGVIRSAFAAITLYVLARMAGALFSLLLRTRWAHSLASIRLRGDILYKWVVRLSVSVMAISWVLSTLSGFGVADDVLNWLRSALSKKIGIGEVGFTMGDLLVFAIVLLASYALSRTAGFFLQEDVLPRLSLQRGLPNAILTVVHYSLLLAGFLMALASVGLDLTRITVLAGAFGLAIGFGLQNILNNFVSGLILLFERPINLGDIIEVNGVTGQVSRIGIRASSIYTAQGADVIVPNSNLVSNQFVNWTYRNTLRRIDLKVMVARGTEPERVLKLLSDVASTSSRVENDPAPVALFSGFGESALNFELRYWVQIGALPEVESVVNLAVASELHRAGIEVPVPQRDLHLKSAATSMLRQPGEENDRSRMEQAQEEQTKTKAQP